MGAWFLRLVFQGETQLWKLRGQSGDGFAEPRPRLFVIGAKQVIIAILSRPEVDRVAVQFLRDAAHLSRVIQGVSAHLRFAGTVAAFPKAFVGKQIGNNRNALQSSMVERFLHLRSVLGAD